MCTGGAVFNVRFWQVSDHGLDSYQIIELTNPTGLQNEISLPGASNEGLKVLP